MLCTEKWGVKVKNLYRQIVSLIMALTVSTAGISAGSVSMPEAPSDPEMMEVHFIDVGQGDATLIKCGEHAMLIDAGDDTKGTTIQNYLQKQHVEQLDYLVLTHPDADHIGGAPVIITKFEISEVFVSNYKRDSKSYEKLMQALDYRGMSCETPVAGSEYLLGTALITILGPDREYEDVNDASLTLIIRNGATGFLFTGDAGEAAEKDILSSGMDISADVYKVGHHGSKDATSQSFFQAVSPEYAVISCGEGNPYGHPHAETLNTLRTGGVKTYRTDEEGSIIAVSDGQNITFSVPPSETWQPGEAVQIQEQGAEQEQAAEQEIITYVLNKNTGKFHYSDCSSVKDMKSKNREDTVKSREEIINMGYIPCNRCRP